jgi:hypothetical protein
MKQKIKEVTQILNKLSFQLETTRHSRKTILRAKKHLKRYVFEESDVERILELNNDVSLAKIIIQQSQNVRRDKLVRKILSSKADHFAFLVLKDSDCQKVIDCTWFYLD